MIIQIEYAIAQERSMNTTEQSLIIAAEQAVIAKFPDFKAEEKNQFYETWEIIGNLPMSFRPPCWGALPLSLSIKGQRTSAVYTGFQ